jgi:peptidoglycan/LPS O-acetylase OafA/YrhL
VSPNDKHRVGKLGSRDRLLTLFLRLVGMADLLAIVVVFLPTAWLSLAHETVGLGILPQGRIVGYLARSTSLLYGIHGALLLVLASDVVRYRPLIQSYGRVIFVAGVLLIGVDIAESMPVWWTVFEGAAVVGIGVVILTLCHEVRGVGVTRDSPLT